MSGQGRRAAALAATLIFAAYGIPLPAQIPPAGVEEAPVVEEPLRAGSDDPLILSELAERRYLDGDLEESARLYLELGRRAPLADQRARALLTAAWLEHLLRRDERALSALTHALTADPDLEFTPELFDRSFAALFDRARHASAVGRQQRAAASLQQALALLDAGRPDQARKSFEEALRHAPGFPAALYNLALLDLAADDEPAALGGFHRAVSAAQRDPSLRGRQIEARATASIGLLHYRQGRDEEAEKTLTLAASLDPADASTWKNLGLARLRLDRPLPAAAAFREAMLLDASDLELPRALAQAQIRAGDDAGALETLRRATESAPGDPRLWLTLGVAESRAGDATRAGEALTRAADLDPANRLGVAARAVERHAFLRYAKGEIEFARELAARAVALDPEAAESWGVLGLAQLAAREPRVALDSLLEAARLDPGRAELANGLGRAYLAVGDRPRAEESFVRALTLNPDLEAARQNLAQVRRSEAAAAPRAASPASPAALPAAGRRETRVPTGNPVVRPLQPKRVGLKFADLDYRKLGLRGALVKEVAKKSPAARAGLRKGDLLLKVGDYEIVSDKDYFQYLRRNPPRGQLAVEFLRNGAARSATLDLTRL